MKLKPGFGVLHHLAREWIRLILQLQDSAKGEAITLSDAPVMCLWPKEWI